MRQNSGESISTPKRPKPKKRPASKTNKRPRSKPAKLSPESLASVKRGLAQAARGELYQWSDFDKDPIGTV